MKRVVVHIERLVLRGVRAEDRHALAAGVQQELTRLLGAPGAAEHLVEVGHIDRLRVGRVDIAADAKPIQVGRAAAAGIGRRLGVKGGSVR